MLLTISLVSLAKSQSMSGKQKKKDEKKEQYIEVGK